ncbi:Peptidoglycan-recognition protein LB [Blattella germanica]|nr:Peptidoglycan-recognition protein LB [Blattella germanica]
MAGHAGLLYVILCAFIGTFLFCSPQGHPTSPLSTTDGDREQSFDDDCNNLTKCLNMSFDNTYPDIVTREEWGAKAPKQTANITTPVPFVVIHHTYSPAYCNESDTCKKAMREMQHMHQDIRGWWDIGYNFCVGGTGKVYEGRGWDLQGAHAPRYNNRSVGICFIGDYMEDIPTEIMTKAGKELIQLGVDRGSIDKDYKLIGHRQVRDTLCPGDKFFEEIQSWEHYDPIRDVVPYPPK